MTFMYIKSAKATTKELYTFIKATNCRADYQQKSWMVGIVLILYH